MLPALAGARRAGKGRATAASIARVEDKLDQIASVLAEILDRMDHAAPRTPTRPSTRAGISTGPREEPRAC